MPARRQPFMPGQPAGSASAAMGAAAEGGAQPQPFRTNAQPPLGAQVAATIEPQAGGPTSPMNIGNMLQAQGPPQQQAPPMQTGAALGPWGGMGVGPTQPGAGIESGMGPEANAALNNPGSLYPDPQDPNAGGAPPVPTNPVAQAFGPMVMLRLMKGMGQLG